MAEVFVDTPVLLHAVDDADLPRQQRAREWLSECWRRRCGRLSMPVLDEFYANARRRFATAISAGDARAEVRRYQLWKPLVIDQATLETAWAAESRHQLPFWDALLVAAAQHQGCTLLLTHPSPALPHGRQIDRLRIVDPFQVGPELLDQDLA